MSAIALRRGASLRVPDLAVLAALALATVLCCTWAVIAGGWNEGMSVALVTSTVAVVEASLVAQSTVGRLAAAIAAPLLGVLVIVPLTLSAMPADGGPATFAHVAGRYAAALGTGLVGSQSWSFIVGFCAGTWALGFWTAWLALRERRGVLAVVPVYVVLASNALNAPHGARILVPEAAAMAASLLLLARTTLADLERSWGRRRVVALPGTRRRYSSVAVAAVGLTLVAGVVLPPLTTTDRSGALFHINPDELGRGNGPGGGLSTGAGAGPAAIGFSDSTTPGGPLIDNPVPVLSYTADTTDVVYLRAVTDTVFRQGSWSPPDTGFPRTRVDFAPPSVPRDRSGAASGWPQPAQHVTVRIVKVPGGAEANSGQGLFPGEPDSIDRGGTAYGMPSAPGRPLATVDRVTLLTDPGNVVVAGGTLSTATVAQLRSAGTAYPAWIPDYLQTSSFGPDQPQLQDIASLARQWTGGLTDPYDMARAVETQIRNAPFVYTLSPPATPSGEWPIHYFLTTSHAGYCQYFASSMGIMLRLLGIPARLVTGYGEGTVDDAAARTVVHRITTSDAHVWVEAYFPGYGWITFEPTPASQDGDYQPVLRPVGPTASALPSTSSAPETSAAAAGRPTPTAEAVGSGVVGSAVPPQLLATVGGVLGAGVLVVVAVSWLQRPRTLRGLWRRLALVGRLLGVRRRPSETQLAYAGRLGAALPPDGVTLLHPRGGPPAGPRVRDRCSEALVLIAVISGKARFSPSGITPQESVRWRRAWLRVTRAIPVLLWRRVLRGLRG